MRPVNLLPENLRPRERREGGSGGAYVVLGVLGALLLAVALYVVTANQVTTRKAETEELKGETQAAEQRAGALAQFGEFQEMKEVRMASVALLAAGRIDWERTSLELARLLPAGVWLSELDATATGEAAASGSSSSSTSSSGAAAGGADAPGPNLKLVGCAPTQQSVAELMVRLRRLHQASDVELVSSEREEGAPGVAGATAAPTAPTASATGAAGPEGCGTRRGRPNYKFEVSVKLAPTGDSGSGERTIPRSLGGGA
jgi:Tfp pilus assembly protein PilN